MPNGDKRDLRKVGLEGEGGRGKGKGRGKGAKLRRKPKWNIERRSTVKPHSSVYASYEHLEIEHERVYLLSL